MGYPDPKKAIIDRLAAPPGHLISQSPPTHGSISELGVGRGSSAVAGR